MHLPEANNLGQIVYAPCGQARDPNREIAFPEGR